MVAARPAVPPRLRRRRRAATARPTSRRCRSEIAKLCPADAADVPPLPRRQPRQAGALPRRASNGRSSAGATCCRWQLLKLLPLLRPWQSLDGELGRYFRDPRVRLAFSFQSKYLGMSPFNCPSLFSILSFLEYEYGVLHPIGGCGAVSRGDGRVAARAGRARSRSSEDVRRSSSRAGAPSACAPNAASTAATRWSSTPTSPAR